MSLLLPRELEFGADQGTYREAYSSSMGLNLGDY